MSPLLFLILVIYFSFFPKAIWLQFHQFYCSCQRTSLWFYWPFSIDCYRFFDSFDFSSDLFCFLFVCWILNLFVFLQRVFPGGSLNRWFETFFFSFFPDEGVWSAASPASCKFWSFLFLFSSKHIQIFLSISPLTYESLEVRCLVSTFLEILLFTWIRQWSVNILCVTWDIETCFVVHRVFLCGERFTGTWEEGAFRCWRTVLCKCQGAG